MPSRKIPVHVTSRAVDVSGRRFSLVPFLLGSTKRNELGRVSGRKPLILLRAAATAPQSNANIKIKRFHSPCGERVHFFCWPHARSANGAAGPEGASIEDASQRNGTKEKGQPRSQRHGALFVPGFFDSPSWLGRKTPHIHVRRPPGLLKIATASRSVKADSSRPDRQTLFAAVLRRVIGQ